MISPGDVEPNPNRVNTSAYLTAKIWFQQALSTSLRVIPTTILIGLAASGGTLALRAVGGLQLLELRAYDGLLSLRPAEQQDRRVVVIGIGEDDLNWLNAPTLTDEVMANLLTQIKAKQPRLIGLDFYRNVPVEPGNAKLLDVFRTTPNLIGIEKVIADTQDAQQSSLPGNKVLAELDQLAASDIAVDYDGRVRRALLFPAASGDRLLEGLGFRLALEYLAAEGISPDDVNADMLSLGGELFPPLQSSAGGYRSVNNGGYQILLNARKASTAAEIVSLRSVLTDSLPAELMRDRIVLIGSTALSGADIFYTAHHHRDQRDTPITFGVELHAQLASQVISRVLDDRPALRPLPDWAEALLVLGVTCLCLKLRRDQSPEWHGAVKLAIASVGIIGMSYGLLVVQGLWLPVIPILLSAWVGNILSVFYRTVQLKSLSENDQLTRLANRRTFDEALQREWFRAQRAREPLGLIMCDVDYFKRFNDTYGHLEGDDCLRDVAAAIRMMRRPADLAARYGGEEFVVLLPKADLDTTMVVAESIRQRVLAIMRPHEASEVSEFVTLSLGVSSLIPSMDIPTASLISEADQALYLSKEGGRNRVSCYGAGRLEGSPDEDASELSEALKEEGLDLGSEPVSA